MMVHGEIRYKVVRDCGSAGLRSYMYKSLGDCAVEYKPGEWTEELIPGSGLFVFKTLQAALDYTITGNVWFVEVDEEPLKRAGSLMNLNLRSGAIREDLTQFWSTEERVGEWIPPDETERYRRIRLIRPYIPRALTDSKG